MLIALIINATSYGQTENNNKQMFVRIYNMDGKKINKGRIVFVRDSLLGLKRDSKTFEIKVTDIGFMKTKRSAGHNLLMGVAIGATTFSAISVASIDPNDSDFIFDETPDTFGDAMIGGVVLGGIAGGVIEAITIPFKNSKTFLINRDVHKWKAVQQMVIKN